MNEASQAIDIYLDNLADGYWRTRDKRSIHVSKMSDAHLESVERLLERIGDPLRFHKHIKAERLRREELKQARVSASNTAIH